jgi:hypothetical protein
VRLADGAGKPVRRRYEDQVYVVRHQAIVPAGNRHLSAAPGPQIAVQRIVPVLEEARSASIAPLRHMARDYAEKYGELGDGYAHVHHLEMLRKIPEGRKVTLKDLAVVCANCHAMIHRGGECRKLVDIVPSR